MMHSIITNMTLVKEVNAFRAQMRYSGLGPVIQEHFIVQYRLTIQPGMNKHINNHHYYCTADNALATKGLVQKRFGAFNGTAKKKKEREKKTVKLKERKADIYILGLTLNRSNK